MGGATWPQDASTAEMLYEKADKAMYRSKRLNKRVAASLTEAPAANGTYGD